MATRKNHQIASAIGKDPEQIQAVLTRVNPSTRAEWIYCAEQIGCDVNSSTKRPNRPRPRSSPAIGRRPQRVLSRLLTQALMGASLLVLPSRVARMERNHPIERIQ
jgi:hypothetical protein